MERSVLAWRSKWRCSLCSEMGIATILLAVVLWTASSSEASCMHLTQDSIGKATRLEIRFAAEGNTTTLSGGNTIVTNFSCVLLTDVTVVSAAVVVNVSSLVHARRDGACETLRRVTVAIDNVTLLVGAALIVSGAGGANSSPDGCAGTSVALNVTSSRFLIDSVFALSPGNFSLLPNFTLLIFNTTFERNSATDITVNTSAQMELRMPGVDDGAHQQFAFIVVSGLVLRSGSTLAVRNVTLTAVFACALRIPNVCNATTSRTNDTYSFASVKIAKGCAVSDHSSVVFSGVVATATTSWGPSARVARFVGGVWFHAAPLTVSNMSTVAVDDAWFAVRADGLRIAMPRYAVPAPLSNFLFAGLRSGGIVVEGQSAVMVSNSTLVCESTAAIVECSNVDLAPSVLRVANSSHLVFSWNSLLSHAVNASAYNIHVHCDGMCVGSLSGPSSSVCIVGSQLTAISSIAPRLVTNIAVRRAQLSVQNGFRVALERCRLEANATTNLSAVHLHIVNVLLDNHTVLELANGAELALVASTLRVSTHRTAGSNISMDGLVLYNVLLESSTALVLSDSSIVLRDVLLENNFSGTGRVTAPLYSSNMQISSGSTVDLFNASMLLLENCTLTTMVGRHRGSNVQFSDSGSSLLVRNSSTLTVRATRCIVVGNQDGDVGSAYAINLYLSANTTVVISSNSAVLMSDSLFQAVFLRRGIGAVRNILFQSATCSITEASTVSILGCAFFAIAENATTVNVHFESLVEDDSDGESSATTRRPAALLIDCNSLFVFEQVHATSTSKSAGKHARNMMFDRSLTRISSRSLLGFRRCSWTTSTVNAISNNFAFVSSSVFEVIDRSMVTWSESVFNAAVAGAHGDATNIVWSVSRLLVNESSALSLISSSFIAAAPDGGSYVSTLRLGSNTFWIVAGSSTISIHHCSLEASSRFGVASGIAQNNSHMAILSGSRMTLFETAIRSNSIQNLSSCFLYSFGIVEISGEASVFAFDGGSTCESTSFVTAFAVCVTNASRVTVSGTGSTYRVRNATLRCGTPSAQLGGLFVAGGWHLADSAVFVASGGQFEIRNNTITVGRVVLLAGPLNLFAQSSSGVFTSDTLMQTSKEQLFHGVNVTGRNSRFSIADCLLTVRGVEGAPRVFAFSSRMLVDDGGALDIVDNMIVSTGWGIVAGLSGGPSVLRSASIWRIANNHFTSERSSLLPSSGKVFFSGALATLEVDAGASWQLMNNTLLVQTAEPVSPAAASAAGWLGFLWFPNSSSLTVCSACSVDMGCLNTVQNTAVGYNTLVSLQMLHNVARSLLRPSMATCYSPTMTSLASRTTTSSRSAGKASPSQTDSRHSVSASLSPTFFFTATVVTQTTTGSPLSAHTGTRQTATSSILPQTSSRIIIPHTTTSMVYSMTNVRSIPRAAATLSATPSITAKYSTSSRSSSRSDATGSSSGTDTRTHRSARRSASLYTTSTKTRTAQPTVSVAYRQGSNSVTSSCQAASRSQTTLSSSVGLPTSDTHRATASRTPEVQAPAAVVGEMPTVQYGNQLLAAASSVAAAAASGGASAMSGSLMRVAVGNNLFKDCDAATMGREADGNYLGLRVGESTGASFRGVVVWSACVLCGCVVVACCAVGVVAARLEGQKPLLRRVVAAQSTLRLPSLLLVPYNTLVTPGVAACVALVGVSTVDTAVCVVLTLLFGGVVAHCACVLLPRRAFGAVLAPTRSYDGRGQLLVSGVTGWRLRVLRFCDGRSDCKEWVCAHAAFEARYRQRHQTLPPAADFVRRYGKLFQAAVGRWWWYDALDMAASFAGGVVVGVSSKSPSSCRIGVWVYAALQVVMCVAVCWLRPYATVLRRCVSCAVGVCGAVSVVLVAAVRWCGAGCDTAADVFALAATGVVVFGLVLKLVAVALMALQSRADDRPHDGGEVAAAFSNAALDDLADATFAADVLNASPGDDTTNSSDEALGALPCDTLQVLVSMICRKVQCGELTRELRVKYVNSKAAQ